MLNGGTTTITTTNPLALFAAAANLSLSVQLSGTGKGEFAGFAGQSVGQLVGRSFLIQISDARLFLAFPWLCCDVM